MSQAMDILTSNDTLGVVRDAILSGYFQAILEMLGKDVKSYAIPHNDSVLKLCLYVLLCLEAEAMANPEDVQLNIAVGRLNDVVVNTAL